MDCVQKIACMVTPKQSISTTHALFLNVKPAHSTIEDEHILRNLLISLCPSHVIRYEPHPPLDPICGPFSGCAFSGAIWETFIPRYAS